MPDRVPLLMQMIRDITTSQNAMEAKFDALQSFMIDHMKEEDVNLSKINERLVRIEERQNVSRGKWAFLAGLLASIVVATVTILVRHGVLNFL